MSSFPDSTDNRPSSQGQLGATAASPRTRYVAGVPSQTFTHTALAAAQVERVWEALDRPDTWEGISGVDRVFDPAIDEQGRLRGFSFETTAGGRGYIGTATAHHRAEREVIAWRIESSEVRGFIRVSLSPVEAGTSVTVNLEVESAGVMSAILFPVISGAIGRGFPETVERFAAELSNRE